MDIGGQTIIAVEWAMVAMCAILTCMRIYIRVFCRGFWTWSDVFVVIAWIGFLSQATMDTALFRTGFFVSMAAQLQDPAGSDSQAPAAEPTPQEMATMVSWLKLIYAEDMLYYNAMYAVKASMLFFYFEIIPPVLRKTYYALWGTVGLTAIGFITEIFLLSFGCMPVWRNWSLDPAQSCQSASHTWVLTPSLTLHLVTDIIIYCLPTPLLRVLSLPKRQKIGVGILFGIGFAEVAIAITVIAMRFANDQIFVAWILTVMEQTWAIVVACCPAFKAFLTRELRKGLRKVWYHGHQHSGPQRGDEKATQVGDYSQEENGGVAEEPEEQKDTSLSISRA